MASHKLLDIYDAVYTIHQAGLFPDILPPSLPDQLADMFSNLYNSLPPPPNEAIRTATGTRELEEFERNSSMELDGIELGTSFDERSNAGGDESTSESEQEESDEDWTDTSD